MQQELRITSFTWWRPRAQAHELLFLCQKSLGRCRSLIVVDSLESVLINRGKICLSIVEIDFSCVELSVYSDHPRTHIIKYFVAVSSSKQPRSHSRQSHGGHLGNVRLEKLSPILSLDVEVGLEQL
jgi:hypothetical protein